MFVVLPRATDGFVNYPQQVDPTAKPNSSGVGISPDAAAANDHYAAILMFIKQNPSRAAGFITDVKQKFFDKSCTVRSDMDLENLVNFSDGVPFR
jgi:hypothetical protein